MPDRSRPSTPPQDSDSQEPGSRGTGSPGSGSPGSRQDDNPFAPPPEGTPDQPWQPRPGNGQGGDGGQGGGSSPWGSQWSDQQPGRSNGGFGDRPGSGNGGQNNPGPEGQGGGNGGGLRWDPTDPAQRRARYALLSGMWAFFFALFGWRYLALLLGALGLYWAISSLRAKPRAAAGAAGSAGAGSAAGAGAATGAATAPAPAPGGGRPQVTAAVSGLVTAALALLMVLATFTAQLVYQDYYTCVDDALTHAAKQSCESKLPKQLRPLLSEDDG
ncbi:hypothetical protein ACQB60_35660 [Actinomycetota bacterium Odt1-20B]